MPKQATAIQLSTKEEETLKRLTKRHRSEQQLVRRAQIILAAARGASNRQIARDLGIHVDTARLWRDRWAHAQARAQEDEEHEAHRLLKRFQDAPRPGAVPTFPAEQRVQMAVFACEAPSKTGRPLSQWTGRDIADALKERGIVSQMSPRHAARFLKKGTSSPTVFGIG